MSKDDLVFTGGSYTVTAANQGLCGKDSLRISGGSFTVTAGKDALHGENADDETLGFVYISGGSFALTAQGDGISASGALTVLDGEFTLFCGGGSESVVKSSGEWSWGGRPGTQSSGVTNEESESAKGLKAGGNLTVSGGKLTIDSADDSLHANGDLTISGGALSLRSGDDGVHADSLVTVSGGKLGIPASYEGIEGGSILISGGEISLMADDDGLNAAGGSDGSGYGGFGGFSGGEFGSTDSNITISGGTLRINAAGDGIDSNGSLTVTGGATYVSGPSDSGNGALDYTTTGSISGGVFVAAGASGMAMNFDATSTQGCILLVVDSRQGGSEITLSDGSGAELLSFTPEKSYNSVLISCPEIVTGNSYTLTAGDSSTRITMESLLYSNGGMSAMGGMGQRGSFPGGKGQRPY